MKTTTVYAGRLKNAKELINSSSGGAFTALSNVFLRDGNAILCSVYDYESQEMSFQLITDKIKRDRARGSKYFQSVPGDAFVSATKWLTEYPKKSLLFIGMGCQAEGFRKYSKEIGISDRVFVVDIICTGVSSPKLWKDYAESIGGFSYLTFKDKRNGWKKPTAVVVNNEKEKSIRSFVNMYYTHNAFRPSCYKCHFAKIYRNSDITIGDYWHIEDKLTRCATSIAKS